MMDFWLWGTKGIRRSCYSSCHLRRKTGLLLAHPAKGPSYLRKARDLAAVVRAVDKEKT